jgi:hypothetical protein
LNIAAGGATFHYCVFSFQGLFRMAATQFVPLTGQLVDEGVFLQDLNLELADLQDAIVKFVEQHGDRAEKAVAVLEVKIQLKVENADDQATGNGVDGYGRGERRRQDGVVRACEWVR